MREVKFIIAEAEVEISKLLGSRVKLYLRMQADDEWDVVPEEVFEAVELITGISKAQVKSPKRDRKISDARTMFCYIVRRHSKLSLYSIGALVGDRDHSTVLHAISKCVELRTAPDFFTPLQRIYTHLNLSLPDEKKA
jgi:chromosomal replication initiation ATPase DnaA